jgi:hypothetical protein
MRPLIRTARLAASAASPSAAHASADIISRPVGGLVGAEPGGHGGCGGAGTSPLPCRHAVHPEPGQPCGCAVACR